MKIREIQYVEDDVTDYQERVIDYDSWDKYCFDLGNHKQSGIFISIPRNCKINELYKDDKQLKCMFYHWFLRKNIIHIATIVDDKTENYVKTYRDDILTPVMMDSPIDLSSEENVDEFAREYECHWVKKEI